MGDQIKGGRMFLEDLFDDESRKGGGWTSPSSREERTQRMESSKTRKTSDLIIEYLPLLLFSKIMVQRGKGSITAEFTILMGTEFSLFLWIRLGRPHSTRKDICFDHISQRLLWKIWTPFTWVRLWTRGVRLREYLLIGILRIVLCFDIVEEADWDLAWRQSFNINSFFFSLSSATTEI